jgi:hypothetical protein
MGLLEKRNVFLSDIGFANAHFRRCNKRNLHRIEFGRNFPSDRIESFFMIVFHRAVDDLRDLEAREVPPGVFRRVLDNF